MWILSMARKAILLCLFFSCTLLTLQFLHTQTSLFQAICVVIIFYEVFWLSLFWISFDNVSFRCCPLFCMLFIQVILFFLLLCQATQQHRSKIPALLVFISCKINNEMLRVVPLVYLFNGKHISIQKCWKRGRVYHVICNPGELKSKVPMVELVHQLKTSFNWISNTPPPSTGNHCFDFMILYTSERFWQIGRFADVKTCVMNSSLNEHVCLKHFDIYDRFHCKLDTSLKDTYTVYLKARIFRTKITRKCFLVTMICLV